VDGAQWVAHFPADVRDIGCDFYAFSGHKLYGPTGIGCLYGRRELLEKMPPYQGGGDMIASVTFEKTVYADLPNKFEAGTAHIAGAVGLGAAIDYVNEVGLQNTAPYECDMLAYATGRMSEVPGLRIVGTAKHKASVISFVMEDPPLASHDIGVVLDLEGIAVRTGHHCCQPVMDRFGIAATARASLAMYNTREDIDRLVEALGKVAGKLHEKPGRRDARAATKSNGEVHYPEPFAATPKAAAEELAEVFDFLGDAQARTQYVMEMGEKIPAVPQFLKNDATRVHGCMSTVHLSGRKRPGTKDVLDFVADSDAHIVRGLIAVLEKLYSGQKATDILTFDVEGFFRRIGLDQFISSQRRNGLAGMIKRIRGLANEVVSGT